MSDDADLASNGNVGGGVRGTFDGSGSARGNCEREKRRVAMVGPR